MSKAEDGPEGQERYIPGGAHHGMAVAEALSDGRGDPALAGGWGYPEKIWPARENPGPVLG